MRNPSSTPSSHPDCTLSASSLIDSVMWTYVLYSVNKFARTQGPTCLLQVRTSILTSKAHLEQHRC